MYFSEAAARQTSLNRNIPRLGFRQTEHFAEDAEAAHEFQGGTRHP